MNDLEERLSGALRDIAARAPRTGSQPAPTLLRGPTRSHAPVAGRLLPVLAAAAVVALIAGAVVLRGARGMEQRPDSPAAEPGAPTATIDSGTADPGTVDPERLGRVASRLAGLAGSAGFGKVVVDRAGGRVVVFWKGDPPAAVTQDVEPGVTVVVRPAAYSEAELGVASRRLFHAARGHRGTRLATAAPNADLTGLLVEVVRPWHGPAPWMRAAAGVPVTVVVVDDAPTPLGDG